MSSPTPGGPDGNASGDVRCICTCLVSFIHIAPHSTPPHPTAPHRIALHTTRLTSLHFTSPPLATRLSLTAFLTSISSISRHNCQPYLQDLKLNRIEKDAFDSRALELLSGLKNLGEVLTADELSISQAVGGGVSGACGVAWRGVARRGIAITTRSPPRPPTTNHNPQPTNHKPRTTNHKPQPPCHEPGFTKTSDAHVGAAAEGRLLAAAASDLSAAK